MNANGNETIRMIWEAMPGFPCLMHRGGLANPMDKWAKALKDWERKHKDPKSKDDDFHIEHSRLQWYGGLYLNEKKQIIWPRHNIKSVIVEAAKAMKKGKDVKRAVFIPGDSVLRCPGITDDLGKLWSNERFVSTMSARIGNTRIMRTRPQFWDWSIEVEVQFMPNEKITADDIIYFSEQAGRLVGLSDYRPEYGRFTVKVL